MGLFSKIVDPLDIFDGKADLLDPLSWFDGGGDKKSIMESFWEKAQQAQPAPVDTLMAPTAMPTADSDAQRAARRKSLASQARRKGRSSTILSNLDPLGVGE